MVIENGSKVTLDTNCLIYYFENHPDYADCLENLFMAIQSGKIKSYISILSLLEILVKPKKENNTFLANRYKLLLYNYPNLDIEEININVVDTAAMLRARYKIKTPDAIIIATAVITNSKYLISNDVRLSNICQAHKITMIRIDELKNCD